MLLVRHPDQLSHHNRRAISERQLPKYNFYQDAQQKYISSNQSIQKGGYFSQIMH